MKILVPSYYKTFRCIADRCRHSCCIGWEIDIDENTLAAYDNPQTPLHREFQVHVDRTDTPHFRLDREERCPFLTDGGLCRIIQEMGEGALCQICADHPRFRHCYTNHEEIGLGLCCEAAGGSILFWAQPMTLMELTDDGEPTGEIPIPEQCFLTMRQEIFTILQDGCYTPYENINRVLERFDIILPTKSVREWVEILRNLERLETAWDTVLDSLTAETTLTIQNNTNIDKLPDGTLFSLPLQNFALYLVFRHLTDSLWELYDTQDADTVWEMPEETIIRILQENMKKRLAFCAFGVVMLGQYMTESLAEKTLTREDIVEFCRLFSAEIEYSEENLAELLRYFA